MENQERPRQQITCPRCGYRMPLWADPEARARTFQTEGGAPYMSLVLD